jgi:hypothetical protein
MQPGVSDHWIDPIEPLLSNRGCGMLEAGVPKDDVSIVVLKSFSPSEYHAVAAARVNGEWLIPDNRTPTLVRDTDVPGTIPVFVIDAEGGEERLVGEPLELDTSLSASKLLAGSAARTQS